MKENMAKGKETGSVEFKKQKNYSFTERQKQLSHYTIKLKGQMKMV